MEADLSQDAKRDAIQQIELLSSEATQANNVRKIGVIKALVPGLERTLATSANLARYGMCVKTQFSVFLV
jgi:hypothetical protein